MSLETSLLVLVGGFIGGVLRFALSGFIGRRIGETFPWGTFVVNVSGALAIGAMAGLGASLGGVIGGYTTVSSFCLQSLNLMLDGERRQASFNAVASALLCILAVAMGYGGIVRIAGRWA